MGARDVEILDLSLASEAAGEMARDVAGWLLIELREIGDARRKRQLRMVATRKVSRHPRVGWACLNIIRPNPGIAGTSSTVAMRTTEFQRDSRLSDVGVLSNDLSLSCASNMAAPRSEVQAEQCGSAALPRQLRTLVRRRTVIYA